MSARPPKKWFYSTVRALRRNPDIDNPEAVAGWIWFHWMKAGTKRHVLKREEIDRLVKRFLKRKKAIHHKKGRKGKMDGKRKRRRSRRYSGAAGFEGGRRRKARRMIIIGGQSGIEGGRRRRHRRMRGIDGLLGQMGPAGMIRSITANLGNTAIAVAGGIGGSMAAAKFLPATMDTKIKSAIPLVVGLVLSGMRAPIIRHAGMGMAILGGVSLAKQFLPATLPVLAGAEDTNLLPAGDTARLLGVNDDVFAQGEEIEGEEIEGAADDIFASGEVMELVGEEIEGEEIEGEAPFITQAQMV
jgi:hypothetical protein